MRKSLLPKWRITAVGVVALGGLGLLGISSVPASAGSADVTAGAAGSAVTAAVPAGVTVHHYTAFLSSGADYHWNVYSNHTAKSSYIPPDGFKGHWTWSKSGGTITFLETNGSGCTWYATKTSTGYNSQADPGLAVCSGVDYTWYATKS